jgi:hypothetical protein
MIKHLLALLEREKKAKLLSLECKKPLVAFYQKTGAQLTCAKTSLVKVLNPKTGKIEDEPLYWMVYPIGNVFTQVCSRGCSASAVADSRLTFAQFHDGAFHERLRRTLYSTVHGLRLLFESTAKEIPYKVEKVASKEPQLLEQRTPKHPQKIEELAAAVKEKRKLEEPKNAKKVEELAPKEAMRKEKDPPRKPEKDSVAVKKSPKLIEVVA